MRPGAEVLGLLALGLVAVALATFLFARTTARALRARRRPPARAVQAVFDPGLERRAEQRARQLLRSCVNDADWQMYRDLGFVRVEGRTLPDVDGAEEDGPPYAYLIYPHKPIVAYVPASGRLLSEYCVDFPDVGGGGGQTRLPPSDDVLAKWMALTSDEARVVGQANMHLVGRQHDPERVRRDLWRLREWERRRGGRSTGARVA